jgi:hypothetical protein
MAELGVSDAGVKNVARLTTLTLQRLLAARQKLHATGAQKVLRATEHAQTRSKQTAFERFAQNASHSKFAETKGQAEDMIFRLQEMVDQFDHDIVALMEPQPGKTLLA